MATAAPNLNLDLADTSSITSEEEEEEDPLRPIHRLCCHFLLFRIRVADPDQDLDPHRSALI